MNTALPHVAALIIATGQMAFAKREDPAHSWPLVAYKPTNVVSSELIKQIAREEARKSGTTAGSVRYIINSREEEARPFKSILAAYEPAKKLFEAGRFSQVVRYLEGVRNANPLVGWPSAGVDGLLADAYIQLKRPQDAFETMRPYLKDLGLGSDLVSISRASTAAALAGRRYPGQEEYCIRSFGMGTPSLPLPSGCDRQRRLVYVSAICMTLVPEYDTKTLLYAKIALDAVPGDPLATYFAAKVCLAKGDINAARRLLGKVQKSSSQGLNMRIGELMTRATLPVR